MVKTILFDLDGTLIDTEAAAAQSVQQAFQEWGVVITPQDASYVTGRTWASALDYLFQKYALPVTRSEASEEVMERYRSSLQESLLRVPGGIEAVQSLASEGKYKMGLVTGSCQREVYWALDQLGIRKLFTVILCAEDYAKSKPAPDGYIKAMALLDSDAKTTLIFEDSEAGIASARAAGCWVVAITSTNHFGHDVSGAHDQITDLTPVNGEWVESCFQRLKVKLS